MNRVAKSCLACLVATLAVSGSAYAAPDEDLYILQLGGPVAPPVGPYGPVTLTKLDISVGDGVTQTDIVTFENYNTGIDLRDLLNSEGVFYVLAYTGTTNPVTYTSKLYTLNPSNGDLTFVASLNVDYALRLFKNPADDSVWVSFDNDNDIAHLPDSVAQIDLSDGQVDLDTIISLELSWLFFGDVWFDAYGVLYSFTGGGGFQPFWWYRVDLASGEANPNCTTGFPTFDACWKSWYGGNKKVVNPDTNETLGFQPGSGNNTFIIWKDEFYETFKTSIKVGEFTLYTGNLIGATFAPNVKSPFPPLPPVLTMVSICEIG